MQIPSVYPSLFVLFCYSQHQSHDNHSKTLPTDVPLQDRVVGSYGRTFLLLYSTVLFVLLCSVGFSTTYVLYKCRLQRTAWTSANVCTFTRTTYITQTHTPQKIILYREKARLCCLFSCWGLGKVAHLRSAQRWECYRESYSFYSCLKWGDCKLSFTIPVSFLVGTGEYFAVKS